MPQTPPQRLPLPEPPRGPRPRVLPLFLPFAGCPQRCVFCDQAAQTGQAPEPFSRAGERLEALLAALPEPEAGAPELAFYGGTFTALPDGWPERLLEMAAPHLEAGRLRRIRCSTRPDAVNPAQLLRLKALGLSLVELGVQSFDDAALAESQRGYAGAAALAACEGVRAAGLGLGVQLMPGMPGQTPEAFRQDVARTAEQRPELARLYPCLVLEGTPLAGLWRSGAYVPWGLEATEDELARALLALWGAGVRVARLGLAEEPGLPVLAGPRHPALGQMARARALLLHVRGLLEAWPPGTPRPEVLVLPLRLRGEALGQGRALEAQYAGLGLRVAFGEGDGLGLG